VYLFAHVLPEITSPTCTTFTVPPQLSEAVTEATFGAGTDEEQATVTGAGQVTVGKVKSLTVIIWLHLVVPALLLAV
jgi:hypothetical protein